MVIYCRVKPAVFVAVDEPLVVRVVWLQVVVERAVVVERVDAETQVLRLVAELLLVWHPSPVRQAAPQAVVEPQDAALQPALKMMFRWHLPSPAEVAVWKQPDYLRPQVKEPLVPPVWFAE